VGSKDPLTGEVICASKTTAVRYERSTRRDRKRRIGFDYVHSLVDDHSRLAYSEILNDERADSCAGFFRRRRTALDGLPPISRLSPT